MEDTAVHKGKIHVIENTDSYFEFLRFSLSATTTTPQNIQAINWKDLFRFGREQAISGILFEGIKKLPPGTIQDKKLLLQQAALARNIELRNLRLYATCEKVTHIYEKAGFNAIILKGQGTTLRYPNILSRTPGDIDLFIDGGEKKVLSFIFDTYGKNLKFNMHHIDMPNIDNVSVEVHFRFAQLRNPFTLNRLNKWFEIQQKLKFDCSQTAEVYGQKYHFRTPDLTFNLVYELTHIYNHIMYEGIGMRQLIDYYMLLQAPDAVSKISVIHHDLKTIGLTNIAGAIMWVLKKTLHLEHNRMIAPPDARRGKFLLRMVIEGGNFGHYSTNTQKVRASSHIIAWLHRLRRATILLFYFPGEAFFDPWFRIKVKIWKKRMKRQFTEAR